MLRPLIEGLCQGCCRWRGVLRDKKLYLSGPIENDNLSINWRIEPKRVLSKRFGLNVFDPFADPKQQWVPWLHTYRANLDYEGMREVAKKFVRKDLALVDRSDMLIAYLPEGVRTTGTIHEIINSHNAKKPTLLVCPQGKVHIPTWFFGFIPLECMFDSWEDLYNFLQEVEDGKHHDNNRWDYIYGKI